MQGDDAILQVIHEAFAGCRRPEHFTNYTHCEECAEHDAVLRSREISTLRIADVGNPGWDPICFTTDEGFAYYFPALARLALAEPDHEHGWYGSVLLFHLIGDGRQNRRFIACTPEQRSAIVHFLQHLIGTRGALADEHCCTDDLLEALQIWSDIREEENE